MTTFRKEQLADNVILFQGDCRDVLPSLAFNSVQAVISDPPYGIEDIVGTYGRAGADRNIANDTNLNVMVDAFELVKKQFNNIWIAAFYSCRISPTFFLSTAMLNYFGEMVWDKKNLGLGTQIRYQHENIAFFKIGNPPELAGCSSVLSYMSIKGEENRIGSHPHEKPNQVMHNLCSIVPGKVILDPFMGTGSTGAAAVQCKRGFIGIELEAKYFELSIKKVKAALAQPTEFWND